MPRYEARGIRGRSIVKNASSVRNVPCAKNPTASLNAFAADEEPETQARSIRTALTERAKQLVHLARCKAAALVFDLDLDPSADDVCSEGYVTAHVSKLDRVLQKVGNHAREDMRVDVHVDVAIHRCDALSETPRTSACIVPSTSASSRSWLTWTR